jgi:CRISPR/Cas system-associated endoribonuclease Cas2
MLLCCYHETSERNEVLLFVTKNQMQKISSSVFGGHVSKQNFSSAEGGAL